MRVYLIAFQVAKIKSPRLKRMYQLQALTSRHSSLLNWHLLGTAVDGCFDASYNGRTVPLFGQTISY